MYYQQEFFNRIDPKQPVATKASQNFFQLISDSRTYTMGPILEQVRYPDHHLDHTTGDRTGGHAVARPPLETDGKRGSGRYGSDP